MQINPINNTNFKGLLQTDENTFFNTNQITGISSDDNGTFVFVNHSERPHAKPCDNYNNYYGQICSNAFYYEYFPKNISLKQAIRNYSRAATKPENIVDLDGNLLNTNPHLAE